MPHAEPTKWDFFLAHAAADTGIAESLYEALTPHARVFLDTRSIQPGDNWRQCIDEAQLVANVAIVLVSRHVKESWYVSEEIVTVVERARREPGHRVVPILVDGVTDNVDSALPYGLRGKQTISMRDAADIPKVAAQLIELSRVTSLGSQVGHAGTQTPISRRWSEPSRRGNRVTNREDALFLRGLAAGVGFGILFGLFSAAAFIVDGRSPSMAVREGLFIGLFSGAAYGIAMGAWAAIAFRADHYHLDASVWLKLRGLAELILEDSGYAVSSRADDLITYKPMSRHAFLYGSIRVLVGAERVTVLGPRAIIRKVWRELGEPPFRY
jgi:hypothetical protein